MKSVASKLRRNAHGCFAVRPTIITDELPAYKEASAIAFGTDADVGMMIKRYENLGEDGELRPSSRYIGSDRVPIIGSPKRQDISTPYVERLNLNVRMDNRRYGRRTNAFSKTLLNHERHIAHWMLHTNYCRIPSPMRQRATDFMGSEKRWIKRVPPAMAALGNWCLDHDDRRVYRKPNGEGNCERDPARSCSRSAHALGLLEPPTL